MYGEEVRHAWYSHDKELEEGLRLRADPLIDLGLANFASDDKIVIGLYERSFSEASSPLEAKYLKGLRVACLSNRAVGGLLRTIADFIGPNELRRIVLEGDGDEVDAL